MEAQQAEASEEAGKPRQRISAEEAAARREEETLRLARHRVLQQLETASNERHRASLQAALASLDEKLRRFRSEG